MKNVTMVIMFWNVIGMVGIVVDVLLKRVSAQTANVKIPNQETIIVVGLFLTRVIWLLAGAGRPYKQR